jgi:hypothetical protein
LKKYDFLWIAVLTGIVVFLIAPATHRNFVALSAAHPYLMAFAKFLILASMGELLAVRITGGRWKIPAGMAYRAVIWGLIGMLIVIVFEFFSSGVLSAMKKGLLPSFGAGFGHNLAFAFFTSTFMNCLFAPTFMAAHRITDTFIDLGKGRLGAIVKVPLAEVIGKIDWVGFVGFVVRKTIPFFWIPAHTVTFLLPPEYRVLAAAFLSLALGGILAFAKRKAVKAKAEPL